MPAIVLDTSAIMCVLFGEEGADTVTGLLEDGSTGSKRKNLVFMPFMALMETEYWLSRRLPIHELEKILLMLETWPVQIVESYPDWRHQAAKLKATESISTADAWIASLAILKKAELLHKDPEFDRLKAIKTIHLPYKKKR